MEITTMILQVLIILMPLGALGAFGSDEGKLDVQSVFSRLSQGFVMDFITICDSLPVQ